MCFPNCTLLPPRQFWTKFPHRSSLDSQANRQINGDGTHGVIINEPQDDEVQPLALTEVFVKLEKAVIDIGYSLMQLEQCPATIHFHDQMGKAFEFYCQLTEAAKRAREACGSMQNKPVMTSTMFKVYIKLWYQHETLFLKIEELKDLLDTL